MTLRYSKPLRIKGIAAPLLRPLPVLFTFLDLAERRPHRLNPSVRRLFTDHLRAFREILVTLSRHARLPGEATADLLALGDRLLEPGAFEPAGGLREGRRALKDLQRRHGPALLAAAREGKESLGPLFRSATGPLRLQVVHHDETGPRALKIQERLVDDCWYDAGIRHENDGVDGLVDSDLVLLVPSAIPIRSDLVQALGEREIACLVLIRTGTAGPAPDMAALRAYHLYRQEGLAVMQGPAVPLRLYQVVDRLCLFHRADHPASVRSRAATS